MGNKKTKMQIIILLIYALTFYPYVSSRPNDFGKSSAWLFKQATIFNICGSPASTLCAAEVEDCMTFYGINPFQPQDTPPSVVTMCAGMPFNECALKMSKCTDLFESRESSGTDESAYPGETSEFVNPGNSEYGSSVYPSESIGFRYTGTGPPAEVSNTGNYRFGGFSSEVVPGEANSFVQSDYGQGSFSRGSLGSNGALIGSVGSGHGGFVLPSEPGNYAGLGYSGYSTSREPGSVVGLEPANSGSSAGSSSFGLAQGSSGSYEEPSESVGLRLGDYSDGDEHYGFGPFIELGDSLTSGYGNFGSLGENSEFSSSGIGGFDSLAETNESFTSEHGNFSSLGEHSESSGFGYNDSIDSGQSIKSFDLGYNGSGSSTEAAEATVSGFERLGLEEEYGTYPNLGYREVSNLNNSEHQSSGSVGGHVEYPAVANIDSTSFSEPSKAEELGYNDYDSPGESSGFSGLEKDSVEPFSGLSGPAVSGSSGYSPSGESSEVTGSKVLNQNGNVRHDNLGPSRQPIEFKVSGQLNFESTGDLSIPSDSGHSSFGSLEEPSNLRDSGDDSFNPLGEIGNIGDSEFGVFASPRDPTDSTSVESNGFRPLNIPSELRGMGHNTSSFVEPSESTDLAVELRKSSESFTKPTGSAHGGFLSPGEAFESNDSRQDNAHSEHGGEENISSKPIADHSDSNATEITEAGGQGASSITQTPVVTDIISAVEPSHSGDSTNLGDVTSELPNIPDRLEALNLSTETVNDRLSVLYACAVRNITKCRERAEKCFLLSGSEVDIASNMEDLSECLKFMDDFVKTSAEMPPSPPDCKGEKCEACNVMLEPTTDFIATVQACSSVLTETYTMKKCMKSTMEHHLRSVTTAAIQTKILSAFRDCYQEHSFEQIHPCLVNACSKIT